MLPLFLDVGDVDLQENKREGRRTIDTLGEESSKTVLSFSIMGAEQEVVLTKCLGPNCRFF